MHNDKLYVESKETKSAFNDALYKTYERKLQKLVKGVEKHYYHDLLVNYSIDMMIWKHHRMSLKYDKEGTETTYSKQIQNWI